MIDPNEKKKLDGELSASPEEVDRTISQTDGDPGDSDTDSTINQS